MSPLLAALFAGCGGPSDDHDHPGLVTGAQLYGHHCAACHQVGGDGAFLRGIPAVRFTQMPYRDMVRYIQGHGRDDASQMPRYAHMSRAEAEKIAVFVRQKLRLGLSAGGRE